MPKASVVITLYNCASTIRRALQSAQQQSLTDLEIIVVDDVSTDGSADIVADMASSDPRIKLIHMEINQGGGSASHRGFAAATGEWVAMLDADDWFQPKRLEIMVRDAEHHNADLVFDNLIIFDHVLDRMVERTHYGSANIVMPISTLQVIKRDTPYHKHPIGYAKPLVRRSFLVSKGVNYRPGSRMHYDFVFLMNMMLNGARTFVLPDANYVYVHRISPTTGRTSPHSRSGTRYNEILESADLLQQTYVGVMTNEEKTAFAARRKHFETFLITKKIRGAYHEGYYGQIFGLIAGHPQALLLAASTLRHRALRRLKLHMST